jgi:nitrogen fixation/metabolism regulation signal transduction histidine kinase
LGLAIVKKIIEEHKGSITIENADVESVGHTGAIVTVSLPVKSTQISSKRKTSVKAQA